MANCVVTLKIMPESPDIDLNLLQAEIKDKVKDFGCEVGKVDVVPVAFGLKSLNIMFVMDENRGTTDALEADLAKIPGVNSVECTDVRRAIG
ncbi:elongation factor 1-beta [Candidatus Woesearchaeota archaeon]|nr:elongation factor 1-beta [Candidatus Woesearchaeota archaeon]